MKKEVEWLEKHKNQFFGVIYEMFPESEKIYFVDKVFMSAWQRKHFYCLRV